MNPPAQSANVFGNDNIIVQASDSGVNVVVGPQPYLRLTQYERRTKLAARDNSEAALLSAYRADVVPLIGREGAMADLRRWLDEGAPVSVRVLVGAGGRGKTRLALELARDIAKDGWLAGFATADELDRFRGQHGVEQWRWDKPVLIILDYAASRADQLRAWIRELVDASLEERPKLRLLLLERQANRAIGWLATVFGLGDNDDSRAAIELLDPKEPAELPALDDLDVRRQVFGALLRRTNSALEAPAQGADPEFDRLLADRKWAGDPLYLMMAGIAAAKAGVKGALALSRADLALSMGRNELDRIGRIGAARGVDDKHRFAGAFVRHMAAIATLLQGLSVAEARRLAAKEIEALGSQAGLDATVDALRDALPASGANGAVAPILPDVVGEGAVLAWFGPNGALATGGVDSARRIMVAARASVGKASATLVRAAQDFAEAGYAEPVRWLEALAGAPETDLGALNEIADVIPLHTLALRETAAALSGRIVNVLRDAATSERATGSKDQLQSTLAAALNNLGNSLNALGRREEALAAARESLDIRRRADARRDAFLPDLASSLTNIGNVLSGLGRREEAAAAAQEATDIYRGLAAARPDAFLRHLAGSLSNLGGSLAALGRPEEALAVAQESVEIRRRLAAADPAAFLSDLAGSLNNLGLRLDSLDRREEALAAAQEAAVIYRRLAVAQPDAFLPDLASSLHNLSVSLSNLGRRAAALATAQEAVDIRRRLAAERPDVFLSALAQSLNNLGVRLSDLGRREEALVVARDAVDIRRRLAANPSEDVLADLASALNNLGTLLSELRRGEEALAAAQEATDIYRRLAAARPDAFLSALAGPLTNLGNRLSDLGRSEEALAAAQAATDVCRRLVAARPDGSLPTLAASLHNLGNRLSALGRPEDALAAAQEATEAYRRLAAERPDVFLPGLALSLNSLAGRLTAIDRRQEALGASQEAVQSLAPFFLKLPAAYAQQIAIVARRYLQISESLGVEPDAALLTPIEEALEKLQKSQMRPNSNA